MANARFCSFLFAGVLLPSFAGTVALPPGPTGPAAQPATQAGTDLEPGKPLERTLQGGEKHIYAIHAESGQFVHATVDQLGIDVALTLYAPDGKPIGSMDSPNGNFGLEQISTIAEAQGIYRLEVASGNKKASAGRYRLTLETLRAPGEQDRSRIQAERMFVEAGELREQGGADALKSSLQKYLASLALWHTLGDGYEEALTEDTIGVAHDQLGQTYDALDCFHQALVLARAAGSRALEADVLTNLGFDHDNFGEKQKALDYYNQALALERALGDHAAESLVLGNMAQVYDDLGEKQKALDYDNQALPLERAEGDRRGEAITLNNMGVVYGDLGEGQKALECFQLALPIRREIGDRRGEARTLNNIGTIYDDLGERQKALEYYNQALPLDRALGNRRGEAASLNNIGTIYDDLGEKQKALEYYNQALQLDRALGDRKGEATILSNIGFIYSALGEKQEALEYYNQALPIQLAVGNRAGEARTMAHIGAIYDNLGEKQKALDSYTQSLPLSRATQDLIGEASTLGLLMKYWKSLQNPGLAVMFGKESIQRIQQVRRNIAGLEKGTQESFLKSKENYYRDLADLLIAQGRLPEAQQVLGLLKQQEYSDYVRGEAADTLSPLALTPAEKQAEEDYQASTAQLVSLGEQWAELKKMPSRTPEQEKQYQQISEQLDQASKGLNDYYSRLYTLFGQNSDANRQVADVKGDVSALKQTIARMPHTVALYTLVGKDRISIIVITPAATVARQYAIPEEELNRKVAAFEQVLRDPGNDPRPLAQELYKILIAPLKADLDQAAAQTLVWSLDGALRYVPMAALYDGNHYVVESYSTVTITPASIPHLAEKPDLSGMSAAAMGISRKYEDGLSALPAVEGELDDVVNDAQVQGANGVLPGTILLNGQFTEKAMEGQLSGQHAVVHIASHFVFNPGDDSRSYLLLAGKDAGGAGFHLTVADFRDNQKLDLGDTQLLTLSACETGMSGTAGNGREVDGLGTTAQLKGAKAVISSLWSVDDASTGTLMGDFYKRWVEGNGAGSKVEALRQAQLDLLLGRLKPQAGASGRGFAPGKANHSVAAGYSLPYYWAPFVLMGNWR